MIIASTASGIFGFALAVTVLCVVIAVVASAWRLFTGPTLADRVVALDLITVLLVVFLVLFKLVSGVNAFVYAAIALALISFLATVAFAHYIDRNRDAGGEDAGG